MKPVTSTTDLPAAAVIREGLVTLQLMTADDEAPLLRFFRRVPAEDRAYLKEDVTAEVVIARWVAELDYRRVLPLLAWDGDRIVGDATLHRSRAEARRHIGEVRVVIDPEYRQRGLGSALLQSVANIAAAEDPELEKLIFEVVPETEPAAARTAEALGFVRTATFSEHIKFVEGAPHDLLVYELRFRNAIELDDPSAYMY